MARHRTIISSLKPQAAFAASPGTTWASRASNCRQKARLRPNELCCAGCRARKAARRVGWGHTTTYGTLAKELGAGPEAARDVGQVMAKNPVALLIPCHRVLAAGGKIGGFSAPGGSAAKIRMLALEGVDLEPPRPAQQSFGF